VPRQDKNFLQDVIPFLRASTRLKHEIGKIYAKKSDSIILLLCTHRGCSDDLRDCAVGTIIRGLILSFTFMKR
jgi:hypothetical protein